MWPLPDRSLPTVSGRSPAVRDLLWRPTRMGVGLAVMVILLWLVGVNYQVNLAYAAAFWLAGFAAVAVLMNLRQLLGMKIDVEMPKEVFAGGQAHLLLTAEDNRRARWLWLCNEEEWQQKPSESTIWQTWQIDETGSCRFEWHVPARWRGYLRVPSLRTASVAPFGLCMVQCVWHWPSDAVVYPAPLPHDIPEAAASGNEAVEKRSMQEGGEDLAYLQEHREGASLQHVAWKTFAKTGELLDKRFEDQPPAADQTVLSYRDYPAGTPKERLAGLLCFRVLEAERAGLAYTLELPKQTITPQTAQREKCLTALALW